MLTFAPLPFHITSLLCVTDKKTLLEDAEQRQQQEQVSHVTIDQLEVRSSVYLLHMLGARAVHVVADNRVDLPYLVHN